MSTAPVGVPGPSCQYMAEKIRKDQTSSSWCDRVFMAVPGQAGTCYSRGQLSVSVNMDWIPAGYSGCHHFCVSVGLGVCPCCGVCRDTRVELCPGARDSRRPELCACMHVTVCLCAAWTGV